MMEFRSAFRLLGLSLISITVFCCAGEVGLRFLGPRSDFLRAILYSPAEAPTYEDADNLAALRESLPFAPPRPLITFGGFKLDRRGFRTPSYQQHKAPGTFRVVALGDSFTFNSGGVPFPQMWHQQVGHGVADRYHVPVEVISLGLPGTGPGFSLRMFELVGAPLQPDLVLLGLFVGNDFSDEIARPEAVSAIERWSYLWRLVSNGLKVMASRKEIARELREPSDKSADGDDGGYQMPGYRYDPEQPSLDEQSFLRIETNRARLYLANRKETTRRWIDDVVLVIERLDARVRQAESKLLVVVIPDQVQISPGLQRIVAERIGHDLRLFHLAWPQAYLGERLSAAGVATVDLLPAFLQAAAEPRLYRAQDTHWSAAGNALAAKEILASAPIEVFAALSEQDRLLSRQAN